MPWENMSARLWCVTYTVVQEAANAFLMLEESGCGLEE
jgi:hypothetical protein